MTKAPKLSFSLDPSRALSLPLTRIHRPSRLRGATPSKNNVRRVPSNSGDVTHEFPENSHPQEAVLRAYTGTRGLQREMDETNAACECATLRPGALQRSVVGGDERATRAILRRRASAASCAFIAWRDFSSQRSGLCVSTVVQEKKGKRYRKNMRLRVPAAPGILEVADRPGCGTGFGAQDGEIESIHYMCAVDVSTAHR